MSCLVKQELTKSYFIDNVITISTITSEKVWRGLHACCITPFNYQFPTLTITIIKIRFFISSRLYKGKASIGCTMHGINIQYMTRHYKIKYKEKFDSFIYYHSETLSINFAQIKIIDHSTTTKKIQIYMIVYCRYFFYFQ